MSFFSRNSLPVTLAQRPESDSVLQVMDAALEAVNPDTAVRKTLRVHGGTLSAGTLRLHLDGIHQIFLIGGGKAAAPMAKAAAAELGEHLTGGFLVTKDGHAAGADLPERVHMAEAGHPVPDVRGVEATGAMLALVKDLDPEDLVICLISGGGSALLTAPTPGTDLAGLDRLTRSLLASGADIKEINTVRKHLSRIKGGRLAQHVFPARLVTLILSDVVGDPLDMIASGPTVPDPTTREDAHRILKKYGLTAPGDLSETSKPGNHIFERVENILIGTNRAAALAARAEAARLGWNAAIRTSALTGEAREAGRWLAGQVRSLAPGSIAIAGGETTVTLGSAPGFGGRNQEMALAAVEPLAGSENTLLITLATDGGDGPTSAAGAVVSGETAARAKDLGLDPGDYLHRHDSHTFFKQLGDLLITGPTQTNVNDLAFLIRF